MQQTTNSSVKPPAVDCEPRLKHNVFAADVRPSHTQRVFPRNCGGMNSPAFTLFLYGRRILPRLHAVPNYKNPRHISSALTNSRRRWIKAPQQGKPPVLLESEVQKVEGILMHRFSNRATLAQALTHRSVVNNNTHKAAFYEDTDRKLVEIERNNERLELLGDRVFGLLASHALYDANEMSTEGQMSTLSQTLVSRKSADAYFRYVMPGFRDFLTHRRQVANGLDSHRILNLLKYSNAKPPRPPRLRFGS